MPSLGGTLDPGGESRGKGMRTATGTVPRERIVGLFKDILAGDVEVRVQFGHENWDEVFAGNVEFIAGKYEITIFNDCDELDYIDSVRYGGKESDFDIIYDYGVEEEFTDSEWTKLTVFSRVPDERRNQDSSLYRLLDLFRDGKENDTSGRTGIGSRGVYGYDDSLRQAGEDHSSRDSGGGMSEAEIWIRFVQALCSGPKSEFTGDSVERADYLLAQFKVRFDIQTLRPKERK